MVYNILSVRFVYIFFFPHTLYTLFFVFYFSKVKKDRRFSFQISRIFISVGIYPPGQQFNAAATRTFTRLSTDRVRFFFFFLFFTFLSRNGYVKRWHINQTVGELHREFSGTQTSEEASPPYLSTFHKLTFKTIYKNDLLSDVYLRAGLDTGYWFLLHKYKPHVKNTLGYFIYFSSLFVYYLLDKHTRAYTLQQVLRYAAPEL